MLSLLRDLWSKAQERLRERAGASAYEHWLKDLRPLALERGVGLFEAKNQLVCDRVRRTFAPLLEDCLTHELGTRLQVQLQPAPDSVIPDHLEVGPLQPVIDESNETAAGVLRALIEGRPLPSRQFLFHGPAGVGKTFLLRWWRALSSTRPTWLDGEALLHRLQAALRDQRLPALREELAGDRPLVVDGVHRLAGHLRLQQEFELVLQAREELESPTLLTSRWHPHEIWRCDPGFVSRLVAGFSCRIDLPGPSGRLRYLRALEGSAARNGRGPAIEELARDLRGTWPELRRAWALQRSGLVAPAHRLRLLEPTSAYRRLQRRICERLQIAEEELLGKGQHRRATFARQALAWLCVQEGLTRAEIGRWMGGRSRAAISYALTALENRMRADADVRSLVEALA